MARLFVTPREIDFISDLTKELTKDVSGQKIYYYRVREDYTKTHDVYEESQNKVFDQPIEVDARVEYLPEEIRTNRFGTERFYTVNAFIHERDMIDRNLDIKMGDYFSYGEIFFEITSAIAEVTMFGQIEHLVGMKIIGKQARMGLIDMQPLGPTNQKYTDDPESDQKTFVQQRGFSDNGEKYTDDTRSLVTNGKLSAPLSLPIDVSNEIYDFGSGFYADESSGPCAAESSGGSSGLAGASGSPRWFRNEFYGVEGQLTYTDERGQIVPATQIFINVEQNVINTNASIIPTSHNSFDIGADDTRIANIYATDTYTGDLHLKNERGHWQIIEEENYLSIINRKTNKRYKFVLEYLDDVDEE
jgi:hypothetical protein